MMWVSPLFFAAIGLALLAPIFFVLAKRRPALGDWAADGIRPLLPLLLPLFAVGLPATFALLGVYLTLHLLRRVREDYRTQGVIRETGWIRDGNDRQHWIRVAYRDATGEEQVRQISSKLGASRGEGRTVSLLVDRADPQDILMNGLGELWFLPIMFVALGSVVGAVFAWAWWTGALAI